MTRTAGRTETKKTGRRNDIFLRVQEIKKYSKDMQELWLIVVYFQGTMLSSTWWRKILNSFFFLLKNTLKTRCSCMNVTIWYCFLSIWVILDVCSLNSVLKSWTLFRRTELCFKELNSVLKNWTLFRRAELFFTELSSVHSNNITELFALLSTDKFP